MPFTPAYVSPKEAPKGTYRFSWVRVIAIGLMLFILTSLCLYLHHTAFVAVQQGLTDGEHKNSAWIAGEIGYLLPFVVICLFQFAVYYKHDRRDGTLQKEMKWEILLVAVLTYAVLLPVVMYISDSQIALKLASDAVIEKDDSDTYITLAKDVAEWFIRFAVPLLLLYVFHASKAHSETTQPCPEVAETPTPIEDIPQTENPQTEIPALENPERSIES